MVYKILIPYGISIVYPPTPIISISLSTIKTNINKMAKKRKQGQKYPEGFTQRQILLKLCEKDKTSTTEIIDFLRDDHNISEQKNIREHHLKKLEKKKLIKRESAGCGYPDYWSVIPDFRPLKELVDRLTHIYKDFESHHSQTVFMRSQYYHSMTPVLVKRFKDSILDNDLSILATHKHAATREQPLTEGDEDLLDRALGANWLALKWVVHFISVEADDRGSILQQLLHSVRNSKISPATADAIGYANGFYDGMVGARPWVDDIDKVVIKTWINEKGDNEKVQLTYARACRQAHPDFLDMCHRRDEPRINWKELFTQLDHLNSNYRYLFD